MTLDSLPHSLFRTGCEPRMIEREVGCESPMMMVNGDGKECLRTEPTSILQLA